MNNPLGVSPSHLFIFYFFVSFLLIMTFDLKAQPASISSAICGLRRIIIVFSFLFKLIKWKWKWKGNREPHEAKKKSFDLGGNLTHDLRIRSTVTLYIWSRVYLSYCFCSWENFCGVHLTNFLAKCHSIYGRKVWFRVIRSDWQKLCL